MILLTGAAGKTGRAILQALSPKGIPVRALVHRAGQVPIMEALGATEAIVGDFLDRSTLDEAFQGIKKVYHICPNVSPDEFSIGENVLTAAKSAHIQHFVYHSVLHPQTKDMPHHWKKYRVEELIFASGLPFTILQPAVYMQNILARWDSIINQGLYPIPYPVETRISLVDLDDLAQVAAIVLTGSGHENATYELVGTPPLPQTEVAETLSEGLALPVSAQEISIETWEKGARETGLGDYQVETLSKMFRYYARFGLVGNPNVLTWLLGRQPTSLPAFIASVVHRNTEEKTTDQS
jgi:uncharacterized protein YbjT (DUF2867 family)